MIDWLGSRESDLSFPLLPPGSDDDPAAASDAASNDSPRDPRDSLAAAAARGSSRGSTPRNSGADEARKGRPERTRSRTRNARRADGASVADDAVSRDGEAMEGGRATSDEDEIETDEDGGREVSGREKTSNGRTIAAGVVALVATAGAALYLTTLWDSLSAVVRVFVVVTFVWLYCVMLMTILLFVIRGKETAQRAARDAPSANGQSSEVAAPAMPLARIRFGIGGVAGTPVPPEASMSALTSSR